MTRTRTRSLPPRSTATGPGRPTPSSAPRRVLVAVDRTLAASSARATAAAIAAASGAELVLLGIAPLALPRPGADGTGDDEALGAAARRQQRLDAATARELGRVALTLTGCPRVRTTLNWGSPASAVLSAARVVLPDLIVVPARHRGALDLVMPGHTARAVVRGARADVLVVAVDR